MEDPRKGNSNDYHAVPNKSDDYNKIEYHIAKNHCPVRKQSCDYINRVRDVSSARIVVVHDHVD